MKTTIDEEYALVQRFKRNRHEAETHSLYLHCLIGEARHKAGREMNLQCVICGQPMEAQRKSKKTCSARCRLRLSRWMRGYLALPKAEIRKREAEVRKRNKAAVRAARRAAKEEEKRKPKRSLEQITKDIKRNLAKLKGV